MERKDEGKEDAGFRVTDRRRAGAEESRGRDETPEGKAAPEAERGAPGDTEAAAGDIRDLPVPDLLAIFIAELHARAWMHMGLMVNPATNLVVKDLPQARLAIDCIASLLEHLAPIAAEPERSELQRMLADLRMNFVRQSAA